MAPYATQVTVQATPAAVQKQKVSKAMKAYLERANEHDEFMKTQDLEFQIGKRHLANMMGADAETFTQEDINVSIWNDRWVTFNNQMSLLGSHRLSLSLRLVWQAGSSRDENTWRGVSST